MRRTFELTTPDGRTRPIVLTVHDPHPYGTGWRVAVDIDGFQRETCPAMRGEDDLEAFLAAVRIADFRLRQLARIHGGTLTLDGDANLRLVLTPLSDDGTPIPDTAE